MFFLLGCECYWCVGNVKVLKNSFLIQRTVGSSYQTPSFVLRVDMLSL